MNPRSARNHLACELSTESPDSAKTRKALEIISRDPELQRSYEAQKLTDQAAVDALESLPVPEETVDLLHEIGTQAAATRRRPVFNPRDPAMLSVTIGFLLLVGLLAWHFLGRAGVFPEEALGIAGDGVKLSSEQFEIVDEPAGSLEDWFLLKGFEKFRVPAPFDRFQAAGAKVFKFENQPVAVLAIPENFMFFMVFDPGPLGVEITPPGTWKTTEFDFKYAAAIREDDGMCFMVVIRGTEKDLQALLSKK